MTFKSSLLKASAYGASLLTFVIVQGCGPGFKAELKDTIGALSAKELAAQKEKAEKEKAEKEKADKAAKEAKEKEEARKREQQAAGSGSSGSGTGSSGSASGNTNDGSGNNAGGDNSSGTGNTGSSGSGNVASGNTGSTGTDSTGSGSTGSGSTGSSGGNTGAPPTGGNTPPPKPPAAGGGTPPPAGSTPPANGEAQPPPANKPPAQGGTATPPVVENKPPASGSKCEGTPEEVAKCGGIPAAQPGSIAVAPSAGGTAPVKLPEMSIITELKDQSCPESYVQAAKRLAHEGSSGLANSGIINGIISKLSSGKMDNPRNACEAQQPGISLVQVEPAQAIEGLAKIFKMDPKVLTHMDRICEKALVDANPNPADAKWLRAYGLVAFAKKWTAYDDGIISILMLRQQLGMTNPDPKGTPVDCKDFQSTRVKAYCEAIAECQTAEQRNQVFTEKARMIMQLISSVQALKGPAQSNDALKKAQIELEKISVLKSPSFKKYIDELGNKPPGETEVRNLLYQNILQQISKLDAQLKEANSALNCVLGTSPSDCSKTAKFDVEFLQESPSRFLSAEAKSATGLLELDRFNTCMGQRRDVTIAEDVVVGAGWIGAGLLTHRFSPRLLKSVKLIATKAPRVAAQGGRIGLAALAGGLATNDSLNISSQCSDVSGSITEHQNLIRTRLTSNETPMTCETHAEEILIADAVESCGIEYAKTFALAGAGMLLPELGVLSKLAKTKLAARAAKLKGAANPGAAAGAGQGAAASVTPAATGAGANAAGATVTPVASAGTTGAGAGAKAANPGASPVTLQQAQASAKLHNSLGAAGKPPGTAAVVPTQPATAVVPSATHASPTVVQGALAKTNPPVNVTTPPPAATFAQKVALKDSIYSAEGAALRSAPKIANRGDAAQALGLSRGASNAEVRQALDAAKMQFNGQGHTLSFKDNRALKQIAEKLAEIESKIP